MHSAVFMRLLSPLIAFQVDKVIVSYFSLQMCSSHLASALLPSLDPDLDCLKHIINEGHDA